MQPHLLYFCFGEDIEPIVAEMIRAHLLSVDPSAEDCAKYKKDSSLQYLLVFGNHDLTKRLIPDTALRALPPESIELKEVTEDSTTYFFARGNPSEENPGLNIGAHYAAYELLEKLGFRFLHPLAPHRPEALSFPRDLESQSSPYWPVRRWHLHTQHPIELTNVLNGWGETNPVDKKSFESMLPEWNRFLEWSIANKQNQVSWYLLMGESWQDFADSAERQSRLKTLVSMAQSWGLKAGLVAPLAFRQQHAWTMIRHSGDETTQIESSIDWLAATGIDFIEIEMGFSEFTHPDDQVMLEWMNKATRYARDRYKIATSVKVHATTGQTAPQFADPETGEALNFNFLPFYADRDLAVMPHTVQYYGLTDLAPTYGNQDFSEIFKYLRWEAGRREVLFYPETAYWVSYDIDVPLFLPIYAERRLADLRLIARAEREGRLGIGANAGSRINGQVNFSSGWEWGYWLNDVVAARAAWNPLMDISDDNEAFQKSLEPITSLFGESARAVNDLLVDTVSQEKDLLINGIIDGKKPSRIEKRNGQAYLQGMDAWDDVADLLKASPTQPQKKGLIAMRMPWTNLFSNPHFEKEISPLLAAMSQTFTSLSLRAQDLSKKIPSDSKNIFSEWLDALEMTRLRAVQVEALYHYVDEEVSHPFTGGQKLLFKGRAQKTLDEAQSVALRRAQSYRTNLARIAAWREGPTAYPYGYLWSVQTLVYWWRDEAKAILQPRSPCFLNILDPIDVALGQSHETANVPIFQSWTVADLEKIFDKILGADSFLDECLNKPRTEPLFPLKGLR